jgi:FMN phosphatase YigB (HAD superfamily)
MTGPSRIDWNRIDLVVFDVDGTLYDQRRLRAAVLTDLFLHSLRARELDTARVLWRYRQVREILGRSAADFLTAQYDLTAAACGRPAAAVEAVVADWVERRPLPWLRACRHPGVDALFRAAMRARIFVGVLSDNPVTEPLAALGLEADFAVSAGDPDVRRMKPHPAGLRKLLKLAGVGPDRALLIGTRVDREGEAARRLGMRSLIRSPRALPGVETFRTFTDPVFQPLLDQGSGWPDPVDEPESEFSPWGRLAEEV